LEIFQKKLLKQLLSLPQNAPDSAIYLLTGFLPVEVQIHKKELQLFRLLEIAGLLKSNMRIASVTLGISSLFICRLCLILSDCFRWDKQLCCM
jgi:hypothetical protein